MSAEASITFFIAIFIFGITPGPGVFALLARALASGAWACFPLSLGMAISDIVYLILATLGLATIAENYSGLFMLIRFIGAAYLIYLGWKMWNTTIDTDLKTAKTAAPHWISGFIQGFTISASNPKVILFYIAFLPTFMDLSVLSNKDIVWVSFLTLTALMAGLMMVSVAASSIRMSLKSEFAVRALNRTAGSIMIGAGLFLFYKGYQK